MSTVSKPPQPSTTPHATDPASASSPSSTVPERARSWALMVLLVASAMEIMDSFIVNIALPSIEADLGASAVQLQWMIAGYPLAFAIAMITGSRLGDRFGRRRLFLTGLVTFTLMSALCGLSPSPEVLVLGRVLQGLGAAAMIPQTMSCIQIMYAPHERAKPMGAFAAVIGLGTVVGPILGALLTEADVAGLGWRLVFLINVPIGIATFAIARRSLPESTSPEPVRFNRLGLLALTGGLLAVLYPLTMGRELDWPAWVFVSMGVGLVVLGGFVVSQRRAERAGGSPLVALSLFAERSFGAGTAFLGLLFVAMSTYFITVTIFLQVGLGYSVLKAGLVNIPFAVVTSVAAGLSAASLTPRLGRPVMQIGSLVTAGGFVSVAGVVHAGGADVSVWALIPALMLSGVGFGLVVSPIGTFALANVPVQHAGSASGLFNTVTQLANAVGVAVLGTVFFSVADHTNTTLPAVALGHGLQVAMGLAAGLMVLATVAAGFLPRHLPAEPVPTH